MGIKRFFSRGLQMQESGPDSKSPEALSSLTSQKDNVVSIVAYKFQRMNETHDRIRARFLTTAQPNGNRISTN